MVERDGKNLIGLVFGWIGLNVMGTVGLKEREDGSDPIRRKD